MGVFVIAEAGSSHDNDERKAKRLIEAAKECGADAVKFQWTSSAAYMTQRRKLGVEAIQMYTRYLEKPVSWLESLKAHADKVGIEFMCTGFLFEDIAVLKPLVSRFKVSAFESKWEEFVYAHPRDRAMYVSFNDNPRHYTDCVNPLYCVSKYPTPIDEVSFYAKFDQGLVGKYHGFSDHTANVLTGAAAVAAGARIVEAHIRLYDTDPSNPDYSHSLVAGYETNRLGDTKPTGSFAQYVQNIRTVERML